MDWVATQQQAIQGSEKTCLVCDTIDDHNFRAPCKGGAQTSKAKSNMCFRLGDIHGQALRTCLVRNSSTQVSEDLGLLLCATSVALVTWRSRCGQYAILDLSWATRWYHCSHCGGKQAHQEISVRTNCSILSGAQEKHPRSTHRLFQHSWANCDLSKTTNVTFSSNVNQLCATGINAFKKCFICSPHRTEHAK